MNFTDVAVADSAFHKFLQEKRAEVIQAIDELGLVAPPRTIEEAVSYVFTPEDNKVLQQQASRRSELEEELMVTMLNQVMPQVTEPDRGRFRYQYVLSTEGNCMHPSHRGKGVHFVRGKPRIVTPEMYTLDELKKNMNSIFIRDDDIAGNEQIRNSFTPTHEHGAALPGVLVSSQHQLHIVNARGERIENAAHLYFRTKSGLRHLFKLAEYLTGRKYNGRERTAIDDYLAFMSVEPKPDAFWHKTLGVIEQMSRHAKGSLENVLYLERYSEAQRVAIQEVLPEVRGYENFAKRPDLAVNIGQLPDNKKRRFVEVHVPGRKIDGGYNPISGQFYRSADYEASEQENEEKHHNYRTEQDRRILSGFTAWHWAVMSRLEPFFVDDYLRQPFHELYGRYLSLELERFQPK